MFNHLSNDSLFIARRLFQLSIYKRNGQEYETFFSKVMRLHNVEFEQVKPQGQFGDRKNDGFIKSSGKYYQIYAPEDPTIKEKNTIDKLVTDFQGLYSYWNTKVTPIKEYYFALNDKYQGAYASLYTELSKIESKHTGIICKPFLAQHLEDIFLNLPHTHIEDVVGIVPSAEDIQMNVSILNELIEYLTKLQNTYNNNSFPTNPNFEEKIEFNSLSKQTSTLLIYGSFQDGALKDYFKFNSTFLKENLKNIFASLYAEALLKIPESENKNDLIFFYILENCYPQKSKAYQDQILVLMAYFFSYCDIFEEPPVQKQIQLF
jgi:hypothetical protein